MASSGKKTGILVNPRNRRGPKVKNSTCQAAAQSSIMAGLQDTIEKQTISLQTQTISLQKQQNLLSRLQSLGNKEKLLAVQSFNKGEKRRRSRISSLRRSDRITAKHQNKKPRHFFKEQLSPQKKGRIVQEIKLCAGKVSKLRKSLCKEDTTGQVTQPQITRWLKTFEAWSKSNPKDTLHEIDWTRFSLRIAI